MTTETLAAARTVLVVDWPSRHVPENLARAGLRVVVRGGPGPDRYREYEVVGDDVVAGPLGPAPDRADLVYSYRPIAELPELVAMAQSLGATAMWVEPGPDASADDDRLARAIVEGAGLLYLSGPDIVEAVRRAHGVHEPGAPS